MKKFSSEFDLCSLFSLCAIHYWFLHHFFFFFFERMHTVKPRKINTESHYSWPGPSSRKLYLYKTNFPFLLVLALSVNTHLQIIKCSIWLFNTLLLIYSFFWNLLVLTFFIFLKLDFSNKVFHYLGSHFSSSTVSELRCQICIEQ